MFEMFLYTSLYLSYVFQTFLIDDHSSLADVALS